MTRRALLAAFIGLPLLRCTPAPVTPGDDAAERTGRAVFFHELLHQPVPVEHISRTRGGA